MSIRLATALAVTAFTASRDTALANAISRSRHALAKAAELDRKASQSMFPSTYRSLANAYRDTADYWARQAASIRRQL